MKTKYTLFRRGAMFYMQDSATGKQTSLRTKDETEATSLLEARNAAQRQPVLNLHLALESSNILESSLLPALRALK
jgi:hypothetical protein